MPSTGGFSQSRGYSVWGGGGGASYAKMIVMTQYVIYTRVECQTTQCIINPLLGTHVCVSPAYFQVSCHYALEPFLL